MKVCRNALAFNSREVQGIFGKTFLLALLSSAVFRQPCLRLFLICFTWEIKGFYQSSLGNEIDFGDIMNVSPNILAKKLKFLKTETRLFR